MNAVAHRVDRRRARGTWHAHVAMLSLSIVLAGSACHGEPTITRGSPDDLAAHLRLVAGGDQATREREVATWILDEATWRHTVVDPYRDLWPAYVHAFDAATPALVARLATPGAITARRHFAGDPRITLAQGRLRWALPVQFPSVVVELGGSPIETVFVFDGGSWRALAGLDEVLLDRVRQRDPSCAGQVALAGASGRCTEVAWVVADAALRGDDARFAHACLLAATLCGNRSP